VKVQPSQTRSTEPKGKKTTTRESAQVKRIKIFYFLNQMKTKKKCWREIRSDQ
jgi:hypothetical protein